MRQATERDRKVGKSVCLLGFGAAKGWAKIAKIYSHIPGGVRLDRLVGGSYDWNISVLLVHSNGKTAARSSFVKSNKESF